MPQLPIIRKIFQALAVLAGIILIVHGALLLNLELTTTLRFMSILEILIGTITVATDTWFILFT